MFGAAFCTNGIEKAVATGQFSWTDIAVVVLVRGSLGVGFGVAVMALVAVCCYVSFSHRLAARHADGIEVSVEGPFLKIRENHFLQSDRKVHFRSIVDYSAIQDSLMRYFDVHALRMTTIAGGQHSNINAVGVKDCLKMRDMLADIDRLRENQ